MIRVAGPSFDDLDPAIEGLEDLIVAQSEAVMGEVAAEVGAVRVAAAAPEEIPEEVPPPGEPLVSLDTLAIIATLWAGVVAAELVPYVAEIFLGSARKTAQQIAPNLPKESPVDFPTEDIFLETTPAQDYLAVAQNRMVRFSDELWEVARAQLLEGFIAGESIDALRDRLMQVPGISAKRARTVARTEVISASNAGSLAMIETVGFTGRKSWMATEDMRTRPTHHMADGQTVAMDDAFLVGGFPLFFPGDPAGPPEEIINCRCTLTYDLDDEPLTAAGGAMTGQWIGVLALEDVTTGDGREFSGGSLTWADLPLPLLWQRKTQDGHDGSVIVGSITSVTRMGNQIIGEGTFDLASPDGAEAARMVADRYLKGVSVDVDSIPSDGIEYVYSIPDNEMEEPTVSRVIFHGGRLRGATLCAIPAFAEAFVQVKPETEMTLASGGEAECIVPACPTHGEPEQMVEFSGGLPPVLTAAAYVLTIPDVPPVEWFSEPTDVDIHGALTITDDGRVFGYLAPAGVAHRSFSERVTVPMGNVDYSLFMGRETLTAGGGRVVTGALTMDCGHASTGFRDPAAAMDHYDNACSIVATVRIGENSKGVWVAGSLVPGLSANQVARIMACQLSGDWRPHRERNGWREFAGALLVPVPGFAMARTESSVKVDDYGLVASAVPVEFASTPESCGCTADYSAELENMAASIGLDLSSRMDNLYQTIHPQEV